MEDIEASLKRRQKVAAARYGAGQVRGRHYVEWVATLDVMRVAGDEDECLGLLLEIIEATERETLYTSVEPPAAYYMRAAIVYRHRGDINAEIAVLERWVRLCPPNRGGGTVDERLAQALEF